MTVEGSCGRWILHFSSLLASTFSIVLYRIRQIYQRNEICFISSNKQRYFHTSEHRYITELMRNPFVHSFHFSYLTQVMNNSRMDYPHLKRHFSSCFSRIFSHDISWNAIADDIFLSFFRIILCSEKSTVFGLVNQC